MNASTQSTFNIASYLPRRAAESPDKPALILPREYVDGKRRYDTHSFKQLNEICDRYAHGLAALGVAKGDRALVMVRPGLEFIALAFALFKMGAVPVLIDPGMGRKNLLSCIRQVKPRAFIAIPLAHAVSKFFPAAFRSVEIRVTVGRRWFWGGPTLAGISRAPWREFTPALTAPGDPAAILFTSGSTGAPKGVCYEHGMFAAQVDMIRDFYRINETDVDMPAFPLFALFSTAFGIPAVIPDMDPSHPAEADPARLVEAIVDHGVTTTFGSPAIWRRVGHYCKEHALKLPSIKRILMAGAPVPYTVLEQFNAILDPAANTHTPYGATEALPVTSIAGREVVGYTAEFTKEGMGTCVGMPLPGVTIKIIKISDEPINVWDETLVVGPRVVGEIVVHGPTVTKEYFEMPEATALAKIRDGERIWHRMGDVGYLDEWGRLWFCGRKTHRVATAQGVLFSVRCEGVFNCHPAVKRSALVGVGPAGGKTPVLIVEPHDINAINKEQLTQELLALGADTEMTRSIRHILFHPSFPVDVRHNVKINRELLAQWAAKQLGTTV